MQELCGWTLTWTHARLCLGLQADMVCPVFVKADPGRVAVSSCASEASDLSREACIGSSSVSILRPGIQSFKAVCEPAMRTAALKAKAETACAPEPESTQPTEGSVTRVQLEPDVTAAGGPPCLLELWILYLVSLSRPDIRPGVTFIDSPAVVYLPRE